MDYSFLWSSRIVESPDSRGSELEVGGMRERKKELEFEIMEGCIYWLM